MLEPLSSQVAVLEPFHTPPPPRSLCLCLPFLGGWGQRLVRASMEGLAVKELGRGFPSRQNVWSYSRPLTTVRKGWGPQ